ncbi:MAG: hypothetical protein AAF390_17310, partial [Pseudomonadota bacterium]
MTEEPRRGARIMKLTAIIVPMAMAMGFLAGTAASLQGLHQNSDGPMPELSEEALEEVTLLAGRL